VADAVAVIHRDGDGQARIDAYAVPDGAAPAVAELRAHLAERLPDYMMPAGLAVLDRLPLTPNGKIDRAALPSPQGREGDPGGSPGARPCDRLELRMLQLWEDVLGGGPFGVTDDFFRLGGHSLRAVALVDRIRAEFGRDLSVAVVFRAPTVRRLCDHLRGDGGPGSGCVLPMRRDPGGGPPLFLVPPTAGNPFPYLPLVDELAGHTVYGLQAAGYDSDEEPLVTLPDIATRYVREIRSVLPEGPYRIAGWSFGGSVAFEMARQLEEAGADVGYVGLIDSTVLGVDGGPRRPDEAESDLAYYGRTVLEIDEERLAGLTERDALGELLQEARAQDMVPAAARTVAVERMARVFMANTRAALRYRCSARLRADLHLVKSTLSHPVHGRPPVHEESWRARTSGRLHVTVLPCDHWNLVEPGFVSDLAAAIIDRLNRASATRPEETPCS
jgi:thioesterase domain-containing protein